MLQREIVKFDAADIDITSDKRFYASHVDTFLFYFFISNVNPSFLSLQTISEPNTKFTPQPILVSDL